MKECELYRMVIERDDITDCAKVVSRKIVPTYKFIGRGGQPYVTIRKRIAETRNASNAS